MNEFAEILRRVERDESPVMRVQAEGRTWLRRFDSGERLILLGGGHVAKAVGDLAAALGFSITVADDRAEFVTAERFPSAKRICGGFAETIGSLGVSGSDYVCILTRGHRWDRECLCALLAGNEPRYLGMIGSRRRVEGLMAALAEQGYDRERLARVHAPIGLPIGAVTPAEIAVSICAQLIECRHARSGEPEDALPQTNTDRAMLRFLASDAKHRAYALVLSSAGSTPVKGGAMMAVDGDGRIYGTIGGGCGEAAVAAQARRLLAAGGECVTEVDMTNDAAAEDGLVCGGTMRVLIRALQPEEREDNHA